MASAKRLDVYVGKKAVVRNAVGSAEIVSGRLEYFDDMTAIVSGRAAGYHVNDFHIPKRAIRSHAEVDLGNVIAIYVDLKQIERRTNI